MNVQEYRDLMDEVWQCRDRVAMAVTPSERDRETLGLELKISQLEAAECRSAKGKDLIRALNILTACRGMLQRMPKWISDGPGT